MESPASEQTSRDRTQVADARIAASAGERSHPHSGSRLCLCPAQPSTKFGLPAPSRRALQVVELTRNRQVHWAEYVGDEYVPSRISTARPRSQEKRWMDSHGTWVVLRQSTT